MSFPFLQMKMRPRKVKLGAWCHTKGKWVGLKKRKEVNFYTERDTRKRSTFLGPNLHLTKNKLLKLFLSLFTNVKFRFFIFRANLSLKLDKRYSFMLMRRTRTWDPSSHAEHLGLDFLCNYRMWHTVHIEGPTSNSSCSSGRPSINFSHTIHLEKALFIY